MCYLDKSHFVHLLHFVLPIQTCLLLQVSLDFLLLHSSPLWWKEHLLLILVLASHHRTIRLQLLWLSHWDIDLDYCDVEWFALETNQDSAKATCLQSWWNCPSKWQPDLFPSDCLWFHESAETFKYSLGEMAILWVKEKKMAKVKWATFFLKVGAYFHWNIDILFSLIF